MLLYQYQYIHQIDSGITNFEQELVKYFNIDTKQTTEKVAKDIERYLKIVPVEIKTNHITLNNKRFQIEKDFLDCSYEQFSRMDQFLADDDIIPNIHKLLAIFVRPFNILTWSIEKYDINKQDAIAEQLLKLDMGVVKGLLSFFFQNAVQSTKYINIHYLNKMKMS